MKKYEFLKLQKGDVVIYSLDLQYPKDYAGLEVISINTADLCGTFKVLFPGYWLKADNQCVGSIINLMVYRRLRKINSKTELAILKLKAL